ncbi:unnamed protein product [Tetraodon nigroviridis]|uniref:(spotted green pufferfish) hypothetical protein n=1 Tax=Tetraodon nigroviridis TaxID=99883 RepID=Q4SNP1_TETNG|nr:unnamed protein product [Tetraodon nigroviridis]
MAHGEIDYNVVFPDAVTSGCKDKHLSKYSSIYNEQGCVTIRYTAPLKTIFISESFGYKELKSTALKLLEILYDYEVENSPVLFHIFSNGGFMLYRYIVDLLHTDKQFGSLCVIGAVVDSAPGSGNVRGAVIRHRDIEAFVDTLKQKGVPVDSFDFVSTPHVGHFRQFPEQYALNCRNFLAACVKDWEGSEMKRRRVQDQ